VKPFKSLGSSVEELVAKIDFSGAMLPGVQNGYESGTFGEDEQP
jgi:hypothetical protein